MYASNNDMIQRTGASYGADIKSAWYRKTSTNKEVVLIQKGGGFSVSFRPTTATRDAEDKTPPYFKEVEGIDAGPWFTPVDNHKGLRDAAGDFYYTFDPNPQARDADAAIHEGITPEDLIMNPVALAERDPQVDAFVEAVYAACTPNPLNDDECVWQNKVLLHVKQWRRQGWISWMKAFTPGHGDGRRCLQWLCDLADSFGVALALEAVPENGRAPARLVRFYKSMGFVKTDEKVADRDGPLMVRPALRTNPGDGLYVDAHGGRWADPEHTVPYSPQTHGGRVWFVPRHEEEQKVAAAMGFTTKAKPTGFPSLDRSKGKTPSYLLKVLVSPEREAQVGAVRLVADDGRRFAIAHRGSKAETIGKWQVSYFDDDGAVGDSVRNTLNEVIEEARSSGYRLHSIRELGG
jgi:GNAT superfamily N-acetyltransferase